MSGPKRCTVGPNGITAYTISAGTIEMIGAAVKTHRSAFVGVMSSFNINLIASAIGCSTPYGPTRIGPSRDCAHAITLRSSSTMYVTPTSVAFNTIKIFNRGMRNVSIIFFHCRWAPTPSGSFAGASARICVSSPGQGGGPSPYTPAKNNVDRSDHRDDVRHEVAAHEPRQRLQVTERRRTDAEAVRIRGLAVADDEVAELAFRRLDRVIRLTRRGFDQARDFADDRSLRNSLRRLTDDAQRLTELLHADEIPIVGVAFDADRHIEVHLGVRGVRLVLADVARGAIRRASGR